MSSLDGMIFAREEILTDQVYIMVFVLHEAVDRQ
jgi:hypothetical protein